MPCSAACAATGSFLEAAGRSHHTRRLFRGYLPMLASELASYHPWKPLAARLSSSRSSRFRRSACSRDAWLGLGLGVGVGFGLGIGFGLGLGAGLGLGLGSNLVLGRLLARGLLGVRAGRVRPHALRAAVYLVRVRARARVRLRLRLRLRVRSEAQSTHASVSES